MPLRHPGLPVLRNIAVMMHIVLQILLRIQKGTQGLMDGIIEPGLPPPSGHAGQIDVPPAGTRLVAVIPLYVGSGLIPAVFPAQKEFLDPGGALKPFVIVHEHKPQSFRHRQPCVSGRRKIIAPCKAQRLVRPRLQTLPQLRVAACVGQNQLAGHSPPQILQRIHALSHGLLPAGDQYGNAQYNLPSCFFSVQALIPLLGPLLSDQHFPAPKSETIASFLQRNFLSGLTGINCRSYL